MHNLDVLGHDDRVTAVVRLQRAEGNTLDRHPHARFVRQEAPEHPRQRKLMPSQPVQHCSQKRQPDGEAAHMNHQPAAAEQHNEHQPDSVWDYHGCAAARERAERAYCREGFTPVLPWRTVF